MSVGYECSLLMIAVRYEGDGLYVCCVAVVQSAKFFGVNWKRWGVTPDQKDESTEGWAFVFMNPMDQSRRWNEKNTRRVCTVAEKSRRTTVWG